MLKRQKKINVTQIIGASGVGLLILLILAAYFGHRRANENTIEFTDPMHPDEASIPFTMEGDMIRFDGLVEGRRVPVVLDTGANLTTVPRDWNLSTVPNGQEHTTFDPGGNIINIRPIIMPKLSLAGCDIININALAYGTPDSKKSEVPINGLDEIHLGNSALSSSIIMIDYRKRILVISTENHRISDASGDNRKSFTSFYWNGADARSNSGGPLLYGNVGGHRFLMIVDSGTGNFMGINQDLLATLRKDRKLSVLCRFRVGFHVKYMGGNNDEEMIPCLPVVVDRNLLSGSAMAILRPAVIVNRAFGTASVIVGTSVFQDYVITIDYPRRTIMLSPRS